MEQFKSKLIQVEMCKAKLAQLEAARDAAKECLLTTFKVSISVHNKIFKSFFKLI